MTANERQFVREVWQYYEAHGRHDLPWRATTDPYRTLVSEVMLQQTQVERVLPKYQTFLKHFPTVRRLAAAPLGEVLLLWQGLGYNRRAKALYDAACTVVREHGGRFPTTEEGLRALPGVGLYTAAAVLAFAHNAPVVLIETNIRTVFIHHFFSGASVVSDAQLLPLIKRTLPPCRAREWYAALMDYGSYLKQQVGNKSRQSRHYKKQSTFAGSDRQLRGAIIRTFVVEKTPLTLLGLEKKLPEFDAVRVEAQLTVLMKEGLIARTRTRYHLPRP